jgi:hypothetical protein
MANLTLTLPKPHPGQQKIIDAAKRFNVLACGRRFGKTALAIDRIIQAALTGAPTGWFSPTYRHLSDTWRELCDVLNPVIADRSQSERRLALIGGGSIEMWSLDTAGDAARGRRYARVVVDEAALVPDLDHAWQSSIRPMLTDFQGDAWMLSTPRGIQHYFKQLFDRGMDPEREDWAAWQMPTSANPHIKPEEIEAARKDMADVAFAQEYLAEFVSWEGAVFRKILEAVLPNPIPDELKRWKQPHWNDREARGHVIGVDWAGSGRSGDYTVFCVVGFDGIVYEVDRMRAAEYAMQRERLRSLIWRYRPVMVLAESNSIGQPQIEQLRRDDVSISGFVTVNQTKARIVEQLAFAFERDEIKVPNDPVLIGELQSFESHVLPATGLMRYSAPDGMHDDCVIALCLAWEAGRRTRGYYPSAMESQRMHDFQVFIGTGGGVSCV